MRAGLDKRSTFSPIKTNHLGKGFVLVIFFFSSFCALKSVILLAFSFIHILLSNNFRPNENGPQICALRVNQSLKYCNVSLGHFTLFYVQFWGSEGNKAHFCHLCPRVSMKYTWKSLHFKTHFSCQKVPYKFNAYNLYFSSFKTVSLVMS